MAGGIEEHRTLLHHCVNLLREFRQALQGPEQQLDEYLTAHKVGRHPTTRTLGEG